MTARNRDKVTLDAVGGRLAGAVVSPARDPAIALERYSRCHGNHTVRSASYASNATRCSWGADMATNDGTFSNTNYLPPDPPSPEGTSSKRGPRPGRFLSTFFSQKQCRRRRIHACAACACACAFHSAAFVVVARQSCILPQRSHHIHPSTKFMSHDPQKTTQTQRCFVKSTCLERNRVCYVVHVHRLRRTRHSHALSSPLWRAYFLHVRLHVGQPNSRMTGASRKGVMLWRRLKTATTASAQFSWSTT